MKMKRILSALLACLLLLTACGETASKGPNQGGSSSGNSSQNGGRSTPGDGSQQEDSSGTADGELPLISFNYAIESGDTNMEFANILAFSQDGIVLWEYTTKKLDISELERVSSIGLAGDGYLFVCDGAVVCLDARTGEERWTNSDFGGAQTCSVIEDGTVYLCGYHGPDLFVITADGETVKKIESLDSSYCWASEMELSGDILTITMSGSPEGDLEEGHPIRVNITDWSIES